MGIFVDISIRRRSKIYGRGKHCTAKTNNCIDLFQTSKKKISCVLNLIKTSDNGHAIQISITVQTINNLEPVLRI